MCFRIRPPILFLIFLLASFPAAALGRKDSASLITGDPTEVSDMFFEVLRCDVTGVSDFPSIEKYAGVSPYPAEVLLHIVWRVAGRPVYLIEKAVPSYAGKIDSTFSADSFLKTETYDWIDDVVDEAASERAGETIEALEMQPPEEIAQAEHEASAGGQEEAGGDSGESPSERRYRDAEGRLRLFSYGTEYFSLSGRTDGRVLVSAEGKNMWRKYYDPLMRLAKKETWNMADTSAQSALMRTDVYYYNGENAVPFASVAESGGVRVESLYDEKGLVYSQTKYSVDEKNDRLIDSRTLRKYNENNKITEEEYTLFQYDSNEKTKQTGKTTRREVYEYVNPDRVPDYYYYEDDTLRMKTVYTDNDAYTTTLYFDNGFTVTTEYLHGRKTKETFMKGKRTMRSRTYGK